MKREILMLAIVTLGASVAGAQSEVEKSVIPASNLKTFTLDYIQAHKK